jgi:hypothetical protein
MKISPNAQHGQPQPEEWNHGWPSAAKPQQKEKWPQKNTQIAKENQHKCFSLCSLRSFAAGIFLELHEASLLQFGWHGWST